MIWLLWLNLHAAGSGRRQTAVNLMTRPWCPDVFSSRHHGPAAASQTFFVSLCVTTQQISLPLHKQIWINIISRCRTSYLRRITSCSHRYYKGPLHSSGLFFSDNRQPIATRGKKARGTLLVDSGSSIKRAPLSPLSVSYYNEISGGHIWRGFVLRRGSAGLVLPLWLHSFVRLLMLMRTAYC